VAKPSAADALIHDCGASARGRSLLPAEDGLGLRSGTMITKNTDNTKQAFVGLGIFVSVVTERGVVARLSVRPPIPDQMIFWPSADDASSAPTIAT
jgi:hypothetical protein